MEQEELKEKVKKWISNCDYSCSDCPRMEEIEELKEIIYAIKSQEKMEK